MQNLSKFMIGDDQTRTILEQAGHSCELITFVLREVKPPLEPDPYIPGLMWAGCHPMLELCNALFALTSTSMPETLERNSVNHIYLEAAIEVCEKLVQHNHPRLPWGGTQVLIENRYRMLNKAAVMKSPFSPRVQSIYGWDTTFNPRGYTTYGYNMPHPKWDPAPEPAPEPKIQTKFTPEQIWSNRLEDTLDIEDPHERAVNLLTLYNEEHKAGDWTHVAELREHIGDAGYEVIDGFDDNDLARIAVKCTD